MRLTNKDLTQLADRLSDEGWKPIAYTGTNHVRWLHTPTGATYVSAQTPSDYRAVKNIERDMKRLMREHQQRQKA